MNRNRLVSTLSVLGHGTGAIFFWWQICLVVSDRLFYADTSKACITSKIANCVGPTGGVAVVVSLKRADHVGQKV